MTDLTTIVNMAKVQASDPMRELASSPAFRCLDGLLQQGAMSQAQVDMYKARYSDMHRTVLTSCTLERQLLDRSKALKAVHAKQTREYKGVQAQTAVLHTELQGHQATLASLTHSLHSLNGERNRLTAASEELQSSRAEHISLMTERAEKSKHALDSRVFELDVESKEVFHALDREKGYFEREKKANNDYLAKRSSLQSEIESMKQNLSIKQSSLQLFANEPDRLRTHVAMMTKLDDELEVESQAASGQLVELEKQLTELSQAKRASASQLDNEQAAQETLRLFIAKKKSNIDEFASDCSTEEVRASNHYDAQTALLAKRSELKTVYFNISSATASDMHDLENCKKKMEKLRRKCETLNSLIGPIEGCIQEKQIAINKLREDQRFYEKKKISFSNEAESSIATVLKTEDEQTLIHQSINQFNAQIAKREAIIRASHANEQKLLADLAAKQTARNVLMREYSRLSIDLAALKQQVLFEQLRIREQDKSLNDALKTIELCGQKYELLKNSKNALVTALTATQAQLSESTEKSRLLAQECTILNAEQVTKDKKLASKQSDVSSAQKQRDLLRGDENRARVAVRTARAADRSLRLEVAGLAEALAAVEIAMQQLCSNYERQVSARNSVGLSLIDRNDELCLLYQQRDAVSNLVNERQLSLNDLETQVMASNREISEFERRIEQARRSVPSVLQFEALIAQRDQLEVQCRENEEWVTRLGKKLETPPAIEGLIDQDNEDQESKPINSNTAITVSRARLLGGVDPEPEQLCLKIEQLEQTSEQKKLALLDKELALSELLTGNEKLRRKAAETRTTSVTYVVNLNKSRADLRSVNRTIMSNISELSLHQASYLQLTAERDALTEQLSAARINMTKGLPPHSEAMHEWQRLCRDQQKKREALLNLQRSKDEQELMTSLLSTLTTAELRPNAYVAEQFGVPKPYGALAPFKPSTLGAQMRHFRIPQAKQIQL